MSRLLALSLALAGGVGCATLDGTDRSADRQSPFADEVTPEDDGDRTFDASEGDDVADLPGSDEDPCRTRGFWSTHPELWPVDALVLGDRAYDQEALLGVLDLPGAGDASRIVAAQVIAAELNLAVGAPAEQAVLDALDDAQDWIGAHDTGGLPFDVQTSSADGAVAVDLAGTLDGFNNRECAW